MNRYFSMLRCVSIACLLALVPLSAHADWSPKILARSDGQAGDQFGKSVALFGNRVLVGAILDDDVADNAGSAYILHAASNGWSEEAKLTAIDGQAGDRFGSALALGDELAVIGAPFHDAGGSNRGAVYIFRRSGSIWQLETKLTAASADDSDRFGSSVALSGNTLMIGALGDDDGAQNGGAVYVYGFDGAQWQFHSKLVASDAYPEEFFGSAITISEDRVSIGMFENAAKGTEPGRAYVFRLENNVWLEEQILTAADGHLDDRFGSSVSLNGSTLAIGAHTNKGAGLNAGAVYLYEFSADTWSESAKLAPSQLRPGDFFGKSVSLSRNLLAVGAPFRDEGATDSGAAFLFRKNANGWSLMNTILPPLPEDGDAFGSDVSLRGKAVIIGAPSDNDDGQNSGQAFVAGVVLTLSSPHP